MNNYNEIKDLPLTLTVKNVADILSISRAGAYNLLDQKGFPLLKIGIRKLVPRDKFIQWMEKNTGALV